MRGSVLTLMLAASTLAGCETLAVSALNAGAPALISHTMSGGTYRTFTAPSAQTRDAALEALDRMGFQVTAEEKVSDGERIRAETPERRIEIDIERISPRATRVGVVAKFAALRYDTSTAAEIITQTEIVMLRAPAKAAAQLAATAASSSSFPDQPGVPPH